jgi:hypothetical protein
MAAPHAQDPELVGQRDGGDASHFSQVQTLLNTRNCIRNYNRNLPAYE